MTQSPAGWYPEPDPNHVGPPGRLRYWDGSQWTEHVHDPVAPAYPSYPGETGGFAPIGESPAAAEPTGYEQQQYGQQYPQYQQYPAYGQYAPYGQPDVGGPTTPDGQRLAGWWQRVLARILDWLIALPIVGVALIPLVSSQWDALSQWFDDLDYAATYGTADPPAPALFDITTGPGITLVLTFMIVPLLYEAVFLLWKQATPGKMIVGLRVRLREQPELPAGNVFGRLGTTLLLSLCSLGSLLDVLWPLWDSKKQALHDKAAKTNVVRVR